MARGLPSAGKGRKPGTPASLARKELLAWYRPLRASIRNVLSLAVGACNKSDWMRAAKQLGIWDDGQIIVPEGSEAMEMVGDVALFEPNQHKRRAYDRFLAEGAKTLDPPDQALAELMGHARFSIFRYAGRHEAAGCWLEDLLDDDRRIWLMDEAMEASAAEGLVFAMRLFDAGPYHAGFGIIVQPDEETVEMCVATQRSSGRCPFRHSLAATLYGDSLRDDLPPSPEVEEALLGLLESCRSSRVRR